MEDEEIKTPTEQEITPEISGDPIEGLPVEAPAEVPAEDAPAAKHKYADRLGKAYPDREYNSDEDYDIAMDELLNDLEGYKERGKNANKKLIALFESEPEVGEVVRDMLNGATFREALARHVSADDIKAIEGDPDYDGWSKNASLREESISKRRKFEEDYSANIGLSEKAVTSFVEKKGMSEQEADEFFAKFDSMLEDINNGKITEDHLEAIMKAFSYDGDVIAATEQGKIAGRNENIVAKKENPKTLGDGLPRPSRSADEADKPAEKENYMDGLVNKIRRKDVYS